MNEDIDVAWVFIFVKICSKHTLWVHVRTALSRRFQRVPTMYVLDQKEEKLYTPVYTSCTI